MKKEEDLIVISKNAIVIRLNINEISNMSRYGSGVKIMNLKEDDLLLQ